jgi:hypothetical protein
MKILDWVAILGALAWLPHVIRYGHDYFSRPRVRIMTAPAPELGFTTFGPILNLRLAFVVETKDIVVSGLKIRLRHESGSEQSFVWQGHIQTLGTLSNPQVGNMPFEKESNVLALKARTVDVDERFIRFQNPNFIEGKQEKESKASSRLMYLQRQNSEIDIDAFLRSNKMTDLYSYIKRSFLWKEGSYTLTFELDSPQPFRISGNVYRFTLSPVDIEELEKNKEQVERDYRDRFISRKEGESALVWSWRYPQLQSTAT